MIYTITAKNCSISDKWLHLIERRVKKIAKRIPFTHTDPVLLRFNINMHRRNGFYDSDILLGLPYKPLYARCEGWESPEALIEEVFDRIDKKLEEYRGKHLKSDSEYYSHESIRTHPEYFTTPQKWGKIEESAKKKTIRKRPKLDEQLRKILVEEYIKPLGVVDKRVLRALEAVPRHLFVPSKYKDEAYLDITLPTRAGQVVSQPSLVGLMVQALKLKGTEKVLEIGTGTGYMSAVLSHLAKEVYTIEIIPALAKKATNTLTKLGYTNVHVITGNGLYGLAQFAPFDAIVVDAAVPHIPQTWIQQLKEEGRIVVPLGKNIWDQKLMSGVKRNGRIYLHKLKSVQITPIIETRKLKSVNGVI
jgi:protein-L-isoaspartate(D-aspartate) O-methyltransferase